MNAKAKVR